MPLANSWYVGANIPGKPRVMLAYLGGYQSYKQQCEQDAANEYGKFASSAGLNRVERVESNGTYLSDLTRHPVLRHGVSERVPFVPDSIDQRVPKWRFK